MKTQLTLEGSYINQGLDSSTLDIRNGEPHGGLKGSNEFIFPGHPTFTDVSDENSKFSTSSSKLTNKLQLWMKQKSKSVFTKKMLYRRLPILEWSRKYTTADAVGDLVAGITVGLTVIPQALAYSGIAGLPAAYGLYGSFLGCIVYIFFGSCKDVPMGPTAISALLTFQTAGSNVQRAILLSFLTGLVELVMGVFGLGFLVDFVSGPVSSGFTSAVSLIIVSSQVKDILGISAKGATFLQMWKSIFADIHNVSAWDTILGFTCIAVLLILRIMATIKIGPKDDEFKSKTQKIVNKIFWLVGTSRNAILVVVCGYIGYSFQNSTVPFKLIGEIPPGMPEFKAPPFSISGNETLGEKDESFGDMINALGSGLIVVPLIALMENIAICKAFANGKTVDATQELIAIGLANVANSFVQGFPGTGSLSRSAVNNASGVRTPLGNIYTGGLVILSLLFFTPFFSFIPKATLAAVIIAAVIFMVEVKVVKPMWRSKKSDLIPGLSTFIACLVLPLELGILFGVGLNVIFILYHAARPKISLERLVTPTGTEYLMITPDRCLIFPSVDYVRNLVNKQSIKQNIPVVIDCSHIYGADFTAATVVQNLSHDFHKRAQPLFFYNLKPSVCAIFEGLSPVNFTVYYREEILDDLLQEKGYKPNHVLIA